MSKAQKIIDIDSKITERAVYGHIGVPPNPSGKPVLFVRGMMQYQEDVGDQLTKISNATIWSPMVEHSAFEDDAYFAAKLKTFGKQGLLAKLFNWLFKRGPYWDRIDTNLGGQDVDEWFKAYRDYILNWLKTQERSFSEENSKALEDA